MENLNSMKPCNELYFECTYIKSMDMCLVLTMCHDLNNFN